MYSQLLNTIKLERGRLAYGELQVAYLRFVCHIIQIKEALDNQRKYMTGELQWL